MYLNKYFNDVINFWILLFCINYKYMFFIVLMILPNLIIEVVINIFKVP